MAAKGLYQFFHPIPYRSSPVPLLKRFLALPLWMRYTLVLLSIFFAILGRIWLNSVTTDSPFIFFFIAILISALVAGFRGGSLATIISALITDYFFIPQSHRTASTGIGEIVITLVFILQGLCISWLAEVMLRALKTLEENQIELQKNERALGFLAEASKILSSSLEYKVTFRTVVQLAVPHISDWCAIDMLDEKGIPRLLAVGHADPQKIKWARQLRKVIPVDMQTTSGLPQVLKTGKSEIYPVITDEILQQTARNKKELKLIRSIGLHSVMIVPFHMHGKTVGGITFVSSRKTHTYDETDLAIAEELASRVSLALENASLYQATQDAVKMRDDFISVASHELKTPITTVKMYSHLIMKSLQKHQLTEPMQFVKKIDDQVNRQTKLIGDLLDVSRLRVGKLEFNPIFFSLNEVVKDTVDAIQTISTKHKISIKGNLTDQFYGDKDRITQVITNLLTNAVKYSPNGGKIIVTLSQTNNTVSVAVQDFGLGISKENQKKVFNQFYQAQEGTEKSLSGLGLGLYISYGIIKRHGGNINIKSTIGEGSTFTITLPIHPSMQKANGKNQ